jgi:hypothetical protein
MILQPLDDIVRIAELLFVLAVLLDLQQVRHILKNDALRGAIRDVVGSEVKCGARRSLAALDAKDELVSIVVQLGPIGTDKAAGPDICPRNDLHVLAHNIKRPDMRNLLHVLEQELGVRKLSKQECLLIRAGLATELETERSTWAMNPKLAVPIRVQAINHLPKYLASRKASGHSDACLDDVLNSLTQPNHLYALEGIMPSFDRHIHGSAVCVRGHGSVTRHSGVCVP